MSGPGSSLGSEFWEQGVILLELVHQKGPKSGPKSGPRSKHGWLERTEKESGELEATQPHFEGRGEHADVQNRKWRKEV